MRTVVDLDASPTGERRVATSPESGLVRRTGAPARTNGHGVVGGPLTPAAVLALQRTVGNTGVARLLQREPTAKVPGEVTTANKFDLTLFLSEYENHVPPEALQRFLAEPHLLTMTRRLITDVLANQKAGRPPLKVEELLNLALTITRHTGTALLLCHNVTKAFARDSPTLGVRKMTPAQFYAHFSAGEFGRTDTGDWYHFFAISLPAFYTASGALDTGPGASRNLSDLQFGSLGATDMIIAGMRDSTVAPSAAYDGWLYANALSFLEGSFYGVDQADVNGESRVHVAAATTGVESAGGTYDMRWKWYVPIAKGIGDRDALKSKDEEVSKKEIGKIGANLHRIRSGEIEAFSHHLLDPEGTVTRRLNNRVAPPQSQPAPQQPPAQPTPSTPPEPSSGPHRSGLFDRPSKSGAETVAPTGGSMQRMVGAATQADARQLRHGRNAYLGRDPNRIGIPTAVLPTVSALSRDAASNADRNEIIDTRPKYALRPIGGRGLLAREPAQRNKAAATAESHAESSPLAIEHEREAAVTALPPTRRSHPIDTADVHQYLVERWREAHDFPPFGRDPMTGEAAGPTDAQIRFGGPLEPWLTPARTIPAPARPPEITSAGTTSFDAAACEGAAEPGACRSHKNFIHNYLRPAVANLQKVQTPYSTAIYALYKTGLDTVQRSPQLMPTQKHDQSYPKQQVQVDVNGQSFPITLEIILQQLPGLDAPNGFALPRPESGEASIYLNEMSSDVKQKHNLAGLEETMVHEAMHVLTDFTEARNAERAAGTSATSPSLDRATYRLYHQALVTAVAPMVTGLAALSPTPISDNTLQQNVASVVHTLMNEALARVEAGIYIAQRNGRSFGPDDVRRLPNFLQAADYWDSATQPNPAVTRPLPDPKQRGEPDDASKVAAFQEQLRRRRDPPARVANHKVAAFLKSHGDYLERRVRPLICSLQDDYLSQRP